MFFPIHRGISAYEHRKIDRQCSVIFPGHSDIRDTLFDDIRKCQIFQPFCPLALRNCFDCLCYRLLLFFCLCAFHREYQLPVCVQSEIRILIHRSKVIHKIRHAHNTIRIFHAVFSPFDQILQFVHRSHRAVCTAGFTGDKFRNVNMFVGIKRTICFHLSLNHHKLYNVRY